MGITASHRHTRRHKMTDDLPNSKNNDDDDGNNSSEEVEGRHLLKEVLKQIVRSGNVSCASSFTNNLTILFPASSLYLAHVRRLFT